MKISGREHSRLASLHTFTLSKIGILLELLVMTAYRLQLSRKPRRMHFWKPLFLQVFQKSTDKLNLRLNQWLVRWLQKLQKHQENQ
ncbi:unnamed protein product [Protopolystoma xenopodis]|uniref:Uncharacterized protein n=1 Tax=Protopolystoma xenopodis TaxID=117903 RepID=A0A448WVD3_9PLAT|nr:unnamed protein product [Protopolystoma xenopodis]